MGVLDPITKSQFIEYLTAPIHKTETYQLQHNQET